MKVAIIYNKDFSHVINTFGMQNKEKYNPSTVQNVAKALESGGHNVGIIDGNMHVIESLQDFMPKVLEGEKMGMVFNMAYGIQGESRYTHVPSLLEMLGIPYVGSTPAGHALALDKVITKIIMQKHGIPTPNFWVFNDENEDMTSVEYPVIVKPKMEAVSFGLKVVYNEKDLKEAVRFIITEFQQQALVEQFIRGREFAVGIIGNNPVECLPILEIDLENDPDAIQTVDDKKSKPRSKICPASLPEKLAEEIRDWSIAAFKALGLRDFARVDIRLDENNAIYLLEINSMASLGATGSYAHAAQAAGYNFKALVNKMLDTASVRYFADSTLLEKAEGTTLPVHVRIRGFLRSREDSYKALLKKMVNINTYVRNSEGVNTLGNLMKKELSTMRFTHESFPQVEVGNVLYFSNCTTDPDILILGNMDNDTKASAQQYFSINGQKIQGTGTWEHKGGLLILLGALQSLRFIKKLNKIKIGILLTTDDSLHGRISHPIVREKTKNAKYVLGLHGAFLDGGVVTSRSGSAVYNFSLNLIENNEASHVAIASRVFNHILEEVTSLSNPEEGLVIVPHKQEFNSNITEPFAHGEAVLSVRFDNPEQIEKTDKKIRALVSKRKYKSVLDMHIDGGMRRPPMSRSEGVSSLYSVLKKTADNLDIRLREEHRWSSSDISFVNDQAWKTDGLGPIGIKPQNKPEYILSHSISERMTLLAIAVTDLTGD